MSPKNSERVYFDLLDLVEKSEYDTAAVLVRSSKIKASKNSGLSSLLALISLRLAIKARGADLRDFAVPPAPLGSSLLVAAEYHFTRGLLEFHRNRFAEGAAEFRQAEKNYEKSGHGTRQLLAAFNAYIGDRNSGKIAPLAALEILKGLQHQATEFKDPRTLAAVHRDKAYIYFQLERYRASYRENTRALRIFERRGPKSDFDLSCLHAADVALVLGRSELARTHLDYVVPPLDSRVTAPLAYLQKRLGHSESSSLPADLGPAWSWRVAKFLGVERNSEALPSASWNAKTQQLKVPRRKAVVVKTASLEGQLLQQLIEGPRSRSYICESLWPRIQDMDTLDKRFYRLINRVNEKIPGLIKHDGQRYGLGFALKLEDVA